MHHRPLYLCQSPRLLALQLECREGDDHLYRKPAAPVPPHLYRPPDAVDADDHLWTMPVNGGAAVSASVAEWGAAAADFGIEVAATVLGCWAVMGSAFVPGPGMFNGRGDPDSFPAKVVAWAGAVYNVPTLLFEGVVALAIDAALVAGSDGSGVDVTFHSGTSGDYLLWDASEEKLILEGTNGATVLDVTDGNVVIGDGTLTLSRTPSKSGGRRHVDFPVVLLWKNIFRFVSWKCTVH